VADDFADFLLARIAEDGAVAREAQDADPNGAYLLGLIEGSSLSPGDRVMVHPKRALAECEAKQWIVEQVAALSDMHEPPTTLVLGDGVLRLLALPYADHPDYRQEWRP